MQLDDVGPAQLQTYPFTEYSMSMIRTVLRKERTESVSAPHAVHVACWSGVCSDFSTRVWAGKGNDRDSDAISNGQLFVFF